MHLRLFLKSRSLLPLLTAFAAVFPLRLHAQNLAGNSLDIAGNIIFGTTSTTAVPRSANAVTCSYIPASNYAKFNIAPDNACFRWSQNIGTAEELKMLLAANNTLSLYPSTSSTVPQIIMDPNTGRIDLKGTGSGIYTNGKSIFSMDASGNLVFANRAFNFANTANFTGASNFSGNVKMTARLDVTSDSYINGIRIGKGAGNNPESTALGGLALNANTTGARNTALGAISLNVNTSGSDNTASGYAALRLNASGSNNTGYGRSALENNTTGASNTAVGYSALTSNAIGSNNTALGTDAGRFFASNQPISSPQKCVFIGSSTKGISATDSNSIVIGAFATGEGSNTTVIGNSNTQKTHLYGETSLHSLKVSGATVLSGTVTLAAPQGDISMGKYAN